MQSSRQVRKRKHNICKIIDNFHVPYAAHPFPKNSHVRHSQVHKKNGQEDFFKTVTNMMNEDWYTKRGQEHEIKFKIKSWKSYFGSDLSEEFVDGRKLIFIEFNALKLRFLKINDFFSSKNFVILNKNY